MGLLHKDVGSLSGIYNGCTNLVCQGLRWCRALCWLSGSRLVLFLLLLVSVCVQRRLLFEHGRCYPSASFDPVAMFVILARRSTSRVRLTARE